MGQKAKPVNSAMFNSAVCDLNSFGNETILALSHSSIHKELFCIHVRL